GFATQRDEPTRKVPSHLSLLTAMRSGEVRSLRVGQLYWKAQSARVGRAKSTAGTGRDIPINEHLAETLSSQVAWLKKRFENDPQPDWYLFPFSNRGRPVDPNSCATTVKNGVGVGTQEGACGLPVSRPLAHGPPKDGGGVSRSPPCLHWRPQEPGDAGTI